MDDDATAGSDRPKGAAIGLLLVPCLALTAGIPFANRLTPEIFGFPFLLAYIVAWILLTPAFAYGAYRVQGDG